MSEHNFKRADHKARALYKLWVKYLPEFVSPKLPQIKVYYSLDRPGNPEHGKNKLLQMLQERLHKIKLAILYDNRSNKEIKRFGNEKEY